MAPCRGGTALLVSRHSESPPAICVRVSCLVIAVGFGRMVPASDAVGKAHGVFMLRGSGAGTYVSRLLPGVTDVNPALVGGHQREEGAHSKEDRIPKGGQASLRSRAGGRRPGSPCAALAGRAAGAAAAPRCCYI